MSKKAAFAVSMVIVIAALATYAMSPVCVPIPSADLDGFDPPIEQRTDRDFYLKIFQRRDDTWLQCKTRVSRWFFF